MTELDLRTRKLSVTDMPEQDNLDDYARRRRAYRLSMPAGAEQQES